VQALKGRLADSFRAFADVFASANLRRLQIAAAGATVGQYTFAIALAVYAYRAGGATAVGEVAVIRAIPAALLAPFAAILADRYPRRRVMIASDLVRAGLTGLAALAVASGWSYWIPFAIVGLVRIASTVFRPAEAALIPSLAETPEQLTAANVSASTIDSIGIFAGPALGGILLASFSVSTVFLVTVGTYLWSAGMLLRITVDSVPDPAERGRGGFLGESTAGFRAIWHEPRLRLIVALYSAQTVVAGAVGVLIVVAAFDLLDLGNSGLGFLNSAAGIGGLVGAVAALTVATRGRMASSFGLGVALFGLPLLVVGLVPSATVALLMLGVIGVGNTITDVAAYTLLQRTASDAVLARVFGVLHSALVGTVGIGAIVAPLLVSAFGIRASLIVVGAFLPLVSGLLFAKLRAVDRSADVPERELGLLREIPIFSLLPIATVELLARRLSPVQIAAGENVFREGDEGDRFFVVGDGEVEVLVDGSPKVEGPGGWFGEIALLRNVPRTATVRARTDVALLALDRADFLAAVTGYAASHEAAEATVSERLGEREGITTI
jgi:MFS family permease